MKRGILIALLVPALAVAGPRRKSGAKAKAKAATPVEDAGDAKEKDKAADAPAPAATTPAAPAGTQAAGTTQVNAPATPAAGASGGAPAPATPPAAEESPAKDAGGPDVDSLRQEYLSLRDELFKSRARANAVASQLYSTRMTIRFTWGSARFYGVSKASIRLDGATVFEDASGVIASDDGVRFDGFVAPGRHLVTFHVEATGKDDDSFTSATESQIVVKAVGGKDLVVAAKGKDSGDIAYSWKKSEKGSYGLGIDVSVKTVDQGTGTGGGAGKKGSK